MTKQEPWFVQERAVAFASLTLSKQHDVTVRPYAGTDMGIDLLVQVLDDGKTTLRYFGVQIIADIDLPDVEGANGRTLSHLGRSSFEAMLPVCVFAIGVRRPEGVYCWAVEPVVDNGRVLLNRKVETGWETLDDAGVAHLISQVKTWYEALNDQSVPRTPDQPSLVER